MASVYVTVGDRIHHHSDTRHDDLVIDYDKDNNVVGVDILDARTISIDGQISLTVSDIDVE